MPSLGAEEVEEPRVTQGVNDRVGKRLVSYPLAIQEEGAFSCHINRVDHGLGTGAEGCGGRLGR